MRYLSLLIGWLLTDFAIFVGSYALAYFLRIGWFFSTDFPFDRYLAAAAVAAPFALLALITTRAFSMTRNQVQLRSGIYIAYSALVGISAFTLIYYFLFEQFFSRLLLIYCAVLSAALLWIWHIVFAQFFRSMLTTKRPVFPTLVVGLTRESRSLIESLKKHRNPLVPVAILDARGSKDTEVSGVPVRGKLDKLENILVSERITHLIQCSDLEQSLNLLSACRTRGITYMLLPSVLGIVERDERVESLEGQPVTMVSPKEAPWRWFFR